MAEEEGRILMFEARLGKTKTAKGNVSIPSITMSIPIIYYTPEEADDIEAAIKLALEARGFEILG